MLNDGRDTIPLLPAQLADDLIRHPLAVNDQCQAMQDFGAKDVLGAGPLLAESVFAELRLVQNEYPSPALLCA